MNNDNSMMQNGTTHRTILGHRADVAETAALTLVDPYATGRIFKAIDFEHDCKVRGNKISQAFKKLTPSQRKLAKQILDGKTWSEIKMNKRTFNRVLKNILSRLQADK